MDKDRAFNKLFLGGTFGKNIKVGDGDLQTEAEAGASIFTGIVQAVADSMNSKDNKNKKDDKKWKTVFLNF